MGNRFTFARKETLKNGRENQISNPNQSQGC